MKTLPDSKKVLADIPLTIQARHLLSQEQPDLEYASELAKYLREEGKFAYAAELYLLLLDRGANKENRDDYLDKLVHCLYKDPDLPSSIKFDFAIRFLEERDVLKETKNSEVLGRLGAIYKNKWQYDNQFRNLLFSRHYYERGYNNWHGRFVKPLGSDRVTCFKNRPERTENKEDQNSYDNDAGYTAINYAFVLDLIANVRLDLTAKLGEAFSDNTKNRLETARDIRQKIIAYFGADDLKESRERPGNDFGPVWVFATLGEAYFGLGKFDEAKKFYNWYTQTNEKNEEPGRWQIDTTAKQLTALAQIHIQLANFQAFIEGSVKQKDKNEQVERINEAACECLTILYSRCTHQEGEGHRNSKDELPDIALRGKAGLALSGGGFRAALFHIGVLARMAELNVLRHVEVLSCVSGGSIAGAYYYLLLKQKLETKKDEDLDKEDYVQIVREMIDGFLEGVQQNIRVRILSSFRKNLRILFDQDYTRTHYLGELYEEILYKKVFKSMEEKIIIRKVTEGPAEESVRKAGKKKKEPIYIHDLLITPYGYKYFNPNTMMEEVVPEAESGKKESFDIKIQNWNRKNKVPMLVLNATSLNTGHNWQFTASWMGEPPGSIQQKVDSKPRLRRMYYKDAPAKYRNKIRLGTAVGASSCVPALFEPLLLAGLYPNLDLMLVDGGVQDNQGVASLLEQECKVLIVSDASGQLPNEATLGSGPLNSFFRSDLVLQEKIREYQMIDLFKRRESAQLTGLFYMHLKKDLHANPVRWKFSKEPTRKIWLKQGFGDNLTLTSYGILKSVQEHVANLRTDLDAFSDAEAYALMYSGYCQAESECDSAEFKALFNNDIRAFEQQAKAFEQNKTDKINNNPGQVETSNPVENWKFIKIASWAGDPEQSENLSKRLKIGKSVFLKVFQTGWKARLLAGIPFVLIMAIVGLIVYLFTPHTDKFVLEVTLKSIGITVLIYLFGLFISSTVARLVNYKKIFLRSVLLLLGAIFLYAISTLYLSFFNSIYLKWGKLENLNKEDDLWKKKLLKLWNYIR